ncbi:hypothetical protein [Myroides sp. 1372]|uniref:hypothetical protein n=2 Tax=Myroides TaxID=76831 RepID=UPI002577BF46|nr:hypothetical protein [Myroides sp. 1372]
MKHFKQRGETYFLKPQYKLAIIVVLGFLSFAYMSYLVEFPLIALLLLVIATLAFWAFTTNKVYLNVKHKFIDVKVGLIHPTIRIPLDMIIQFEFHILSQNLIRTNAQLVLRYRISEGEKTVLIAQGFTKAAMEKILNELEKIIADTKTK